jgi:hypothetical protein
MRLQLVHDEPTVLAVTLAEGDEATEDDTALPVDDEQAETPGEEPDAKPEEESSDEPVDELGAGHRWLLAVEGVPTGDGREFEQGSLTWRELPLPFMATDITGEGHDGAQLVANIVRVERDGDSIYGFTENIESNDPNVLRLQKLIDDGNLRGVSVDLDAVEGSIIFQESGEDEAPAEPDADGNVELPMTDMTTRFSAGRIMGATAVPFPAFAEAGRDMSWHEAPLVAGATRVETEQPSLLVAIPVAPPAEWFANPTLNGPTPLTVTDQGRVFGHLAVWNSCHIGFSDKCVTAPKSPTNYASFHTGELKCADGSRVRVGQITTDSGHAELSATARMAKQHYDHTGWAAADVCCGEDQYGIWMSGALRPDLSESQVRAVMAADVSGDWRSIKGSLDLVGVASVNVPGFPKVEQHYAQGMVASLVANLPVCPDLGDDSNRRAVADRIAHSVGLSREQKQGNRDRIAFGVGLHPSQRAASLAERVRGA